jgi:FkbM family methyltransferase
MDDVFENVVAENRRLRQELKTLNARVAAFEASRWWRLHPRFAVRRLRSPGAPAEEARGTGTASSKVVRVARQWRMKALYEQRNADLGSDEIAIRDGIRLKVHPESRYSFEEFSYGSPEMVDELDAFIAKTSNKRRLLDVGALHGVFSLVFATRDPAKEALAVDASPIAFAKLLYNIHKNEASNVTAWECALSSEAGFLEMHYDWEHAVAGGATADERPLRVESQTGDALCAAHSFAPDVMKIDVEGHELRVVEGLRATIAENRPLIFLELHPAMMRANEANGRPADLVRVLAELGYPNAELGGSTVSIEKLAEFDGIERMVLSPALQ